jgi:putative transposase
VEQLLPWLYLKGLSTGDFQEALSTLLGPEAPGLSASTISRLKESWKAEQQCWSRRDLSHQRYVYLWVDGIHFGVRLEDAAQCILVVIGATPEGKKELVALSDGYRESEASWGSVVGPKVEGLEHRSPLGDWRRRPRLLESAAAGLRYDAQSALLGA